MLMLKRKPGQTILVGDDISITVTEIEGGRATLAVRAPREIKILRSELDGIPPRPRRDATEESSQ